MEENNLLMDENNIDTLSQTEMFINNTEEGIEERGLETLSNDEKMNLINQIKEIMSNLNNIPINNDNENLISELNDRAESLLSTVQKDDEMNYQPPTYSGSNYSEGGRSRRSRKSKKSRRSKKSKKSRRSRKSRKSRKSKK